MIGDSLQTACCFSFCTLFESSASVFSLQQGAIRAVEKCCDSAPFFQGGVTTKFIEENKEQLLAEDAVRNAFSMLAAARGVGSPQASMSPIISNVVLVVIFVIMILGSPIVVSLLMEAFVWRQVGDICRCLCPCLLTVVVCLCRVVYETEAQSAVATPFLPHHCDYSQPCSPLHWLVSLLEVLFNLPPQHVCPDVCTRHFIHRRFVCVFAVAV